MTEKLFYQDSSIKEFTATVESCMQGKDGMFEVILDQTAFFPEGGGQFGDQGWIDGIKVCRYRSPSCGRKRSKSR